MKYSSFFTFQTVLVIKFEVFRYCSRFYGYQPSFSAKAMCSSDAALSPRRIPDVAGFEDRKNDVVYGPPSVETKYASVVVFFPGDVQDYTENMETHRDNRYHKQWNLESTVVKLQKKFQDCHILVIKPSRMGFKTFSCFKNFVHSNPLGVPEHSDNHNALRHLSAIIKNTSERLKLNSLENGSKNLETTVSNVDDIIPAVFANSSDLEKITLKLIGFSKGCVVLNQLLHEFYHNSIEKDMEISSIISKITDMYWLDGGHSGGEHTWVTDKSILSLLSSLEISIHVHVTPYQIQDDRRPWIKKEEKAFSDYLTKHGCKIQRVVHFESIPPSITTHFDVINAFKK